MFFIVKNYPETFTKDNLWGAVIITLPFVLLKMLIDNLTAPAKKKWLFQFAINNFHFYKSLSLLRLFKSNSRDSAWQ